MFGIHISKQSGLGDYQFLEDAADDIVSKYNLNTCQIFLYGPQTRRKNNYNANELKKLSENTHIYVHSTYITDGYWSAAQDNNELKLKGYYKHIQDQLTATEEIDGKGLVIHITRKSIDVLVLGMDLLQKNIKQNKAKIILEFRAMKPGKDCSYERPAQINKLCGKLKKNKLNWGLCIDTAHMWSSGIKMQDLQIIKNWFSELAFPEKISLFHLNSSKNNTFNAGKDVHIVPFAENDDIWGNITNAKIYNKLSNTDFKKIKNSSIGFFILWAKKNKVPIIGEFKRGKKSEFEFAISVCQAILK